jgi:hypothetical protein
MRDARNGPSFIFSYTPVTTEGLYRGSSRRVRYIKSSTCFLTDCYRNKQGQMLTNYRSRSDTKPPKICESQIPSVEASIARDIMTYFKSKFHAFQSATVVVTTKVVRYGYSVRSR